jgi:hypothetical protein
MLRINSDNSSNRMLAGHALHALRNNPLLIRRSVGVAAALIGLGLMTALWDGYHDPLLVHLVEPAPLLNERVDAHKDRPLPTPVSQSAAEAAR